MIGFRVWEVYAGVVILCVVVHLVWGSGVVERVERVVLGVEEVVVGVGEVLDV